MKIFEPSFLAWSKTDPVFRVTIECDCGASKTYTPNLDQLRKVADDYTVHRDIEGEIEWVEGTTRNLKCPKCGATTSFYISIHRGGFIKIQEAYHFKLGEDDIEVGDPNDAEFHPKLKLFRWLRESWLKVLFDDGPFTSKQIEIDGVQKKVKWITPLLDIHFYQLEPTEQYEHGGIEFEIILKQKPPINSIELPIETENLTFYFQPPLTECENPEDYDVLTETEAWKDGVRVLYRPPNVVGSHVLYHTHRKGHILGQTNYKTGKMGTLYLPHLIDAIGNEAWGEYNRDPKKDGFLKITLPQEFLNKAVYPVSIDPTFGKTDVGASGIYMDTGYMKGSKYNLPEDGTLTHIHVYTYYADNTGRAGCYDDDGADGKPSTRKTYNPSAVSLIKDQFNEVDVPDVELTSGDWWLLFSVESGNTYGRYDSGDTDQWVQKAPDWTDPFGSGTHEDRAQSIYATYTTAGGEDIVVEDVLGLADVVLRHKGLLPISDALGLTEVATTPLRTLLAPDTGSLTDIIYKHVGLMSISDVASLAETIFRGKLFAISDAIDLTEVLSTPTRTLLAPDTISLAESVLKVLATLLASDTVGLSDDVWAGIMKLVDDVFGLSDSVLTPARTLLALDVLELVGIIKLPVWSTSVGDTVDLISSIVTPLVGPTLVGAPEYKAIRFIVRHMKIPYRLFPIVGYIYTFPYRAGMGMWGKLNIPYWANVRDIKPAQLLIWARSGVVTKELFGLGARSSPIELEETKIVDYRFTDKHFVELIELERKLRIGDELPLMKTNMETIFARIEELVTEIEETKLDVSKTAELIYLLTLLQQLGEI